MADILVNFSCSDPNLSRDFSTEEVWMLASHGHFHENSVIVMTIILIIFLLVGIPWNIMVIIIIAVKGLYKEPTYILLLNLVCADLSVYVFVMPLDIASALAMKFTIGNSDYERCIVCQTTAIAIICLVFVSLFTLALMSVDRLVYIKYPLKYTEYIKIKATWVAVLIIWIICIIISILPAFGIGEIKYANVLSFCTPIIGGRTHVTSNINYLIIVVLFGSFPFMTALIANVWLLILICKSIRSSYYKNKDNSESRYTDPINKRLSKTKMKLDYHKQQLLLAKIFGAMFVANVITWLPIILISLIRASIGTDVVPAQAFAYMVLAFLSQPVVHPILETCLVGRARYICLFIFCKKRNVHSHITM